MTLTISGYATPQPPAVASTADNAGRKSEQQTGATPNAADKVSLGGQEAADSLTYDNPRSVGGNAVQSRADLQVMLEESERKAQEIIDLILAMVGRQGKTMGEVIRGQASLQADPETIAAARAAIAEDGEWGVRQTADRILNFAQAAIGGDPSKLESIRTAVEKGFREATDILGGKLPEISEQTYATVMAEFDRWRESGLAGEARANGTAA